MTEREDWLKKAQEIRDMAARVRRLAQGISLNPDQERLLRHAQELEADAAILERRAAGDDPAPPPGVRRGMPMQQVQQQVQQQGDATEPEPEPKPPRSST